MNRLLPARRRAIAPLALALCALAAPSVHADSTLWYNGDYDNRDATVNQSNVPVNNGSGTNLRTTLVYDNFVVPAGQSWTITSIYSNDQIAFGAAPTTATWQIRSGMSAGNGGTLVASGDGSATETALTKITGDYYAATPYKIAETITSVTLTAGTYWLAIAPDSMGYYGDQSYIMTTSGANSIGSPPGDDGDSYINSNFTGPGSYNFASTTAAEGSGTWDYSMGVVGTATILPPSVPEPTSLLMVALGLAGTSAWRHRRHRRRRPVAA